MKQESKQLIMIFLLALILIIFSTLAIKLFFIDDQSAEAQSAMCVSLDQLNSIRSGDHKFIQCGGSKTTVLGSIDNRECMLTGMYHNDANTGGEQQGCEVYTSGEYWYLKCYEEGSDDSTWCGAYCISW